MGMLQVWVHDNRGGYQDMWAGQVRGVKGRGGGRGGLGEWRGGVYSQGVDGLTP